MEGQARQAGEIAEFGWNRTGKVVGAQVQARQAGEVAEFWRNGSRQAVGVEGQGRQAGEVAPSPHPKAHRVEDSTTAAETAARVRLSRA